MASTAYRRLSLFFVVSSAFDQSGTGTVWYYEAGITWPKEATRVSVTVEELGTGFAGGAVAALPQF